MDVAFGSNAPVRPASGSGSNQLRTRDLISARLVVSRDRARSTGAVRAGRFAGIVCSALLAPAGCGKSPEQQRAQDLAIRERAAAAAKADLDAYRKRLREIAANPTPLGSDREERK